MKFTSIFFTASANYLRDYLKDSDKREENKINLFIFYPEHSYLRPQPKCDKREENKINLFIFYPERSYLRPQPKCDKREENKKILGVNQGAKHRLRGLMPRNMVAPYEMRSSEVRGNGFVIK